MLGVVKLVLVASEVPAVLTLYHRSVDPPLPVVPERFTAPVPHLVAPTPAVGVLGNAFTNPVIATLAVLLSHPVLAFKLLK